MKRSVVYFVQNAERVKIGTTTDLPTRLIAIRSIALGDLRLLGAVQGGRELEKALHSELSASRVSGEWFEANVTVLRSIDRLLDERGLRGDAAMSLTAKRGFAFGKSGTDERAYVAKAVVFAERLISRERAAGCTTAQAISKIAAETGTGTLVWTLRYRLPSYVTAGSYFALENAADHASVRAAQALVDADHGEE